MAIKYVNMARCEVLKMTSPTQRELERDFPSELRHPFGVEWVAQPNRTSPYLAVQPPWSRVRVGFATHSGSGVAQIRIITIRLVAFNVIEWGPGVYILASQKNSPPPLKLIPVFVDFFAVI